MSNLFYYTGFFFIATSIFGLFKKEEEITVLLNASGYKSLMVSILFTLKKLLQYISTITSLFFLIWIIAGFYSAEHILFVALIFSFSLPTFFYAITFFYELFQSDNPIANSLYILKKIDSYFELRVFTKFMTVIDIFLIAIILYVHFNFILH